MSAKEERVCSILMEKNSKRQNSTREEEKSSRRCNSLTLSKRVFLNDDEEEIKTEKKT